MSSVRLSLRCFRDKGEVRVDQAHRGYTVVEDDIGKVSFFGRLRE